MGYTSERTTINKSLESLNQETQRLQKQTNYEFDRLNQRRRDNIAGNAEWLQNNQLKLDVGMQQYRELQDSYEPESGWDDATQELMGEMRDQYYNLLQNKVPKLDKNGDPIEGEYVEDIKRSNEEKANLMKGVKTVSQMQGAYKAIDEQINTASQIANGKPGAVDGTSTNPDVLNRHKPGVKMVPKYENGKIVNYQYNPTGQDKDGNYTYDMSKPDGIMDGGNYVRGVEAGEIGISTYGDGGEARNQMQTERYDIYAEDFSKFKDATDLNDVQTYKDFTETFQNFKNDLAKMDVSHIINDNAGMAKNWTNIVDRMAENASSDFYADGENPFYNMLKDAGVDKNNDGVIEGTELNAIAGAWREGDETQRKLAETFYRTYDPSSGILPSYINDMVKTSQTIGGDQLSKKEREDLKIKQANLRERQKENMSKDEKLKLKIEKAKKEHPNAISDPKELANHQDGKEFGWIDENGNYTRRKWVPDPSDPNKGQFKIIK